MILIMIPLRFYEQYLYIKRKTAGRTDIERACKLSRRFFPAVCTAQRVIIHHPLPVLGLDWCLARAACAVRARLRGSQHSSSRSWLPSQRLMLCGLPEARADRATMPGALQRALRLALTSPFRAAPVLRFGATAAVRGGTAGCP